MFSEIGSSFWMNPNIDYFSMSDADPKSFGIVGNDFAWLSTGRSAIALALQHIQSQKSNLKKVALLPSYTCESVIEPFLKNGFSIEFLSINRDLSFNYSEIEEKINLLEPSVFLFHPYFGFDTAQGISKVTDIYKKKGVFVIEDRTQCLYSDFPISDADYFVGSIRKWCEAPDGGFVVFKDGKIENKPTQADTQSEKIRLSASYAKYEYLINNKGDKQAFLQQYALAEELLEKQSQVYCMAATSRAVQCNLDVDRLKSRRRKNYSVLLQGLKSVSAVKPLFDYLPDEVVPLYMPVLAEDRTAVQLHLRENLIYAPVIWPKAEGILHLSEDTQYLYDHMLCIPVDQRYSEDDMKRIISCLKEKK